MPMITLKREGTCKQCGSALKAGARANWYPNGAVIHKGGACPDEDEE